MKVLLINGSPNEEGCTYTALMEAAEAMEREDVGTEIFWIGKGRVNGCMDCGTCRKTGKCAYQDAVNDVAAMAGDFDGFIFGSPVHYASAGGAITSFMDRLFFSAGKVFRGKPAAAVVSARRAGTTAALDQLNKYFLINGMPIVPSKYWNMVHGNTPMEVMEDKEGLQIMRTLGRNMVWLIKCIAAGKQAGIGLPPLEEPIVTNFIR